MRVPYRGAIHQNRAHQGGVALGPYLEGACAHIPLEERSGVVGFAGDFCDVCRPTKLIMKLYAEVFGIVDLGERLIVDLVLGLDGVLLVGDAQELAFVWMELHHPGSLPVLKTVQIFL